MYGYAIERIRALEIRRSVDGGEMLEGWKRELQVMLDIKTLIEWLDQQELERLAAADRTKGRRK